MYLPGLGNSSSIRNLFVCLNSDPTEEKESSAIKEGKASYSPATFLGHQNTSRHSLDKISQLSGACIASTSPDSSTGFAPAQPRITNVAY